MHYISSENLSLEAVHHITTKNLCIALSSESLSKIKNCRKYLENRIKHQDDPIYGINTGFGALCNTKISTKNLNSLQKNLILSHACGMGETVPREIVKLMLLLKIQSLSLGYSGITDKVVESLILFYNRDIIPVVYQQGSLGASGDLAPLAHLTLPLLGLGKVYYKNQISDTEKVFAKLNIKPIQLKLKEGLAMINGTQFMSAYGVYILNKFQHLLYLANHIAALSIDAFDASLDPFHKLLHEVRSHHGQNKIAGEINTILQESELAKQPKQYVQDPYSFRCIPQVHGASFDAYEYVSKVFINEINSVTDNPIVFPDEDKILSGGNFHGQPLAIALDFIAIAMSEIGSISERRIYQLISGKRGLPSFLTTSPGLNSGLMIPQYTAASLVSQNKQLCTPASIDTIDSSLGQEDHVSMGANSATKAFRILENIEKIIAVELLVAAQAIEFRRPKKTSPILEKMLQGYRRKVPKIEDDTYLKPLMDASVLFIRDYKF